MPFAQLLANLSQFAVASRANSQLNKIHLEHKSQLRSENLTRWSSSYLMLLTLQRAYLKGIFNDEYHPAASLNSIETYLKILRPAYIFSLKMEKTNSSIADIRPNLNDLFHKWNKITALQALMHSAYRSFQRKI